MLLREHQSKEQGLNDKLNYAYIHDGIIYNKDGALLMAFKYIGPDMDAAGKGELDGLVETVNRALLDLTDGWMVHFDDVRVPSLAYPQMANFPSLAARLVDDERRFHYESGQHFESMQYLTFVWKFPKEVVTIDRKFFFENLDGDEKRENLGTMKVKFKNTIEKCLSVLKNYMHFEELNSAELLSFLTTCITGKFKYMQVPPADAYLDVVLASEPLLGGLVPKIGDKHIATLSIMSSQLDETYPGILEALSTYPLTYRVSNRFIPLSPKTADVELKRFRKQWNNKITGFAGLIAEALFNKQSKNVDENAMVMKDEVKNAIQWNNSGQTRFGFWNCQIVFMSEDSEVLATAIKDFKGFLDGLGFNSYLEDINAMDAYLGTIPGHGSCNVRRILTNSRQVSHLLPLNTLWAGDEQVSKSSFLPKNAPVCFYANSIGSTPFRFNIDHEDIGHQVILGPSGAGKSTYLQLALSQFLRYENARVFVFDKDLSHHGWTHAMGGQFYNIGEDSTIGFAPFKLLETKSQLNAAKRFVEMLCELQGMVLTPVHKQYIADVVNILSKTKNTDDRSISSLLTYADDSLKAALRFYTLSGSFDMLDSQNDSIRKGYIHTFEMGWLIKQEKQYYLPVLMHQFNTISSFLEESKSLYPTIIVLEEGWQYLEHPIFSKFIIDWMKTFRKFNARVWIATQSLSDLYDPSNGALRPSTAAILDNCATRVFLPNTSMDEKTENLYSQIGLSERQIEIIKSATPKRDYYVVRPPLPDSDNKFSGNRLFDFGWSNTEEKPLALSFIGLNKTKSTALSDLIKQYPNENQWIPKWLESEGQLNWLEYFNNTYYKEVTQDEIK